MNTIAKAKGRNHVVAPISMCDAGAESDYLGAFIATVSDPWERLGLAIVGQACRDLINRIKFGAEPNQDDHRWREDSMQDLRSAFTDDNLGAYLTKVNVHDLWDMCVAKGYEERALLKLKKAQKFCLALIKEIKEETDDESTLSLLKNLKAKCKNAQSIDEVDDIVEEVSKFKKEEKYYEVV